MKSILFAATLMTGTSAWAQPTQPTPPQPTQPGMPAPPEHRVIQIPSQTWTPAPPPRQDYPTCSRTVTDNCVNRGGR